MSTGDEVVDPATQNLGPGQIRDANRSMLLAAASQAGAQVCAAFCTLGVALAASGQVQGSPCMVHHSMRSTAVPLAGAQVSGALCCAVAVTTGFSAASAARRVLLGRTRAWRSADIQ